MGAPPVTTDAQRLAAVEKLASYTGPNAAELTPVILAALAHKLWARADELERRIAALETAKELAPR